MRNKITTLGLLFTFFYFLQLPNLKAQYTPGPGEILYVDSAATGSGTGSNWANAVTSLADALHYARANASTWNSDSLRIYVAKGTYLPKYRATDSANAPTSRDDAFVMVKNVQLFGGFPSGGGSFATRHYRAYPTILSGDIGLPADTSDNCFHVVVGAGDVGNALMDGFIITKGNANVYSNATINTYTLDRNAGGAMRLEQASPRLSNLIIINNRGVFAGGINPNSCASIIKNVRIIYNTAGGYGGGMYINGTPTPTLINVKIADNSSQYGGGIFNNGSSPTLTNVTIANNSASSQGGGIFNNTGTSPVINNTILYGNTAATDPNILNWDTSCHPVFEYSYLGQSGTWNTNWGINGGNNIISLENPFLDTANSNFQLNDTSQAIGGGSNALYIGNLSTDRDLLGNFRLIGDSIDIGAYEYLDINPSFQNIVYVDSAVIGGNHSGNSWANAVKDLAKALHSGRVNASNFNGSTDSIRVYVAKGTYCPKYRADDSSLAINDRDDAFVMVKNLQVYGGFNPAIGDSTMTTRNWNTNPTILSGDIGIQNNNSDNCYHVVISSDSVGNALLDGFIVSNGNGNGSGSITVNGQSIYRPNGGGLFYTYSTLNTTNLIIVNNSSSYGGGGIYTGHCSLILKNLNIMNNTSPNGGGIYNNTSSPILSNTTMINNTAQNGGGLYNIYSSPTLINVLIANNSSSNQGGGVYNYNNSSPSLTNVTIANNTSNTGGGIYDYANCNLIINNSIIFGNIASSNNIISNNNTSHLIIKSTLVDSLSWNPNWGTNAGNNLLSLNNPFKDTTNGNFQLGHCAYPVNAGSNALYNLEGNVNNNTDLAGNPRLFGDSIDMGAYEAQVVGIPPIVNLGNDTSICQGESDTLDAGNAGSTYLWSDNSTNQTLSVSLSGTYYVTVTDSDYCTGSDTINIAIDSLPTISISSNSPICSGSTLNLNASGGNTYSWTGPNGFSSSIQNPTITSATVSAAGMYLVVVTNANGCSDSAQETININPSPVVSLGADTSFCSNGTISLTLDAGNAGASYLWSDNSTNQTLIVNSTGTYSVIVTNTFGCVGGDTITISTTPFPVASFTANVEADGNTIAISNGSTNANSYIWDFGNGDSSNNASSNFGNGDSSNNASSNFEYTYPNDSTYTITLIASNSCGSDTTSQEIKLSSPINIPTGITPNGDGKNDKWIIPSIKVPNSVVIFNRWGDVVWKAKNYDNNKNVWGGTNQNGKDLPDATYFYLIKANGKTYKGWINISR